MAATTKVHVPTIARDSIGAAALRNQRSLLAEPVNNSHHLTMQSLAAVAPANAVAVPSFRNLVEETDFMLKKQRQKGADYKFREGPGLCSLTSTASAAVVNGACARLLERVRCFTRATPFLCCTAQAPLADWLI